ncbi:MAG: metallophosphoesterase family protein [Chloroflexota bacterium]|nr:metallophosphoesterase family protein [Chloroflexota bacterium]
MRIGLIADTHIPDVVRALSSELCEALRGVDLILHAGDIYISSVLDDLELIAPVYAARGDDDCGDIERDPRVRERHELEVGGLSLWLCHQRPWQGDHYAPDIVVFGHDHQVVVQRHSGTLYVNPGSPYFPGYRRGPGTVGILEVSDGWAEAHIVPLEHLPPAL